MVSPRSGRGSGSGDRPDPETYVVRVRGRLSPRHVDRLGGMVVADVSADGDRVTTTLRGELPDQSALFGVLSALHGWLLPVVSVAIESDDGAVA